MVIMLESSDLLALCDQYFPGLEWILTRDSEHFQRCIAEIRPFRVIFELRVSPEGAMLEVRTNSVIVMRSLNEQGQTVEQVLARVQTMWMEYCQALTGALCAKVPGVDPQ